MPRVVVKVDDGRILPLLKIRALNSNLVVLFDLIIFLKNIRQTLMIGIVFALLLLRFITIAALRFQHIHFVDAIALVWLVFLRINDLIKAGCLVVLSLVNKIAILLREVVLLNLDGEEARIVHDSIVIDTNELSQ